MRLTANLRGWTLQLFVFLVLVTSLPGCHTGEFGMARVAGLVVSLAGASMFVPLAPSLRRFIRRRTVPRVTSDSTYADAADVFELFKYRDFDEAMDADLDRWCNEGGA
jgi:hypothetical protein